MMILGTGKPNASILTTLNDACGLTIVEVLLAVCILSVGIVGVLQSYWMALDVLGSGQETIDSVSCITGKMADLEEMAITEEGFDVSTSNGIFSGRYADLTWETRIVDGPVEGLKDIIISVSSKQTSKGFSVETYGTSTEDKET